AGLAGSGCAPSTAMRRALARKARRSSSVRIGPHWPTRSVVPRPAPARRSAASGSARARLARHAAPAPGVDVLPHLRGAAPDDAPEREHVVVRPRALVGDASVLLSEPAVVAEDLERGTSELMVQLAGHQLVHGGVDARRTLAQRVRELPERLQLHGLDADGEIGQ